MQPQDSFAIAKRVRDLLSRRGISRDQHAAQISMLLEIGMQTVYKKLKGDTAWTLDDIYAIARAMRERPGALIDDPVDYKHATLTLNGESLDCFVRTGDRVDGASRPPYVAQKQRDQWLVHVGSRAPAEGCLTVEELVLWPPLESALVAIVDDDVDTTENIALFLRGKGFRTVALNSFDDLRSELQTRTFDAFILDWHLGGRTAEDCVRVIRQASRRSLPIFLLTGNLGTELVSEADITRVMREHRLRRPFEKPYRLEILAAELNEEIEANRTSPLASSD